MLRHDGPLGLGAIPLTFLRGGELQPARHLFNVFSARRVLGPELLDGGNTPTM